MPTQIPAPFNLAALAPPSFTPPGTVMLMTSTISETSRLAALAALDMLDTRPEPRFDRFTRLAAMTFGVPIALISLVDRDRQWFKSRCGLEVEQTPRAVAFCAHTVAQGEMLVVEDAATDARFADNPLVTGGPHIRFYAGQPVYCDGQAVGTLCVIDRNPRRFDAGQRQCLRDLADLVEVELNQARVTTARVMAEQALKSLNAELEQRVAQRTTELEARLAELSAESAQRRAAEASLRAAQAWNHTIVATSYSAFIGADSNGRITEWNAAAKRIFGWSRAEVLGRALADLIVPEELRAAHAAGMRRFMETGASTIVDRQVELPALTASGSRITVEMRVGAYEWQGRRCVGAFIDDVSERNRTRQELEEKQELLDAVLESIDVAVVACDAEGNLTLFNKKARMLHGLDRGCVNSSDWSAHYSLFEADGHTPLAASEVPLMRVLRGEVVREQALAIAPAGRPAATLLASGRPLRSSSGRALGAVVAMQDITERNAAREQLETSERRLRAITENLPALIGKVDAAGKFVFLNGRAIQFYGKRAEALIGQDVRAAYSEAEYAKLEPHLRRVHAGERSTFEEVVEVNGRQMHYQCVFVPQRAPDGTPDGYYAMAFDITGRRLSELRQAESEERLRTITDNVPVLIAYLDADRRYAFANAVHASWLGVVPDRILGLTVEQAFGPEFHAPQAKALEQAWLGNASQCEHEIVRKNHTRIAHSTFLPQLRDGRVAGVYILTTDATASRMHERNLHALAHTDALTQLPNRRRFEQALEGAATRARQGDRECALLYLDVDFFKQINDRYGHATGDDVLVEFARRLRASVRSSDLVARLAGDEFTVLLHDVRSGADVERVARKILDAIAEPFELSTCTLNVGTTIGIGFATGGCTDPRALMETADRALYVAKKAGRNTYAILHTGEYA
jgi:diguanylate cyclase (GGDEF)-like protein/PAS domain S-box-containing protein